jgi:hypothetical protein
MKTKKRSAQKNDSNQQMDGHFIILYQGTMGKKPFFKKMPVNPESAERTTCFVSGRG